MKIWLIILFFIAGPVCACSDAWDFPSGDLKDVSRVAIYRGSFDPLHKGHESIVEECLKEGFSHVFLFPAFGLGEKDRSPLKVREEMLCAFAEKEKGISVFTFDLKPEQEREAGAMNKARSQIAQWVQSLQKRGVKVYKVLGEDSAAREVKTLPNRLPVLVDGYVLATRTGYPTHQLREEFRNLGIETIPIDTNFKNLSSTWLRRQFEKKRCVRGWISHSTAQIIQKYDLYQ